MTKRLVPLALLAAILAVFALVPASASSPATPLHTLAGCFGHNGIQAANSGGPLIAYECVYQPSNDGGALYWSANESAFGWDKHPAGGLLWVVGYTLHPAPDTNPSQPYQAFWVGIGRGTSMCTVIDPGYDQHPTQCERDGVAVTMSPRRQASYDGFVKAIEQARVPDCAWSQVVTADEGACDVDS